MILEKNIYREGGKQSDTYNCSANNHISDFVCALILYEKASDKRNKSTYRY